MSAQIVGIVPQIRFKAFKGTWEARRFRDIVSNLSGGASIKPEDYQKDGIRTVPKGAVNSSGIAELSGSKYISNDFFVRNQSSKVSAGNLITSLRDLVPSAPNLGRIVKIEGQAEEFLMPQGVYKIELHAGIDEAFVITYSNAKKFRQTVASEKNGSTQVHLRNGEFLDIDISMPSGLEQIQIGGFFRKLDGLIQLHQRKHGKLVTLKKAMLQKMFPQPGATVPEIRFKGFKENWGKVKLGTVASLINGRAYSQGELLKNGKYKVLRVGNFYTNSSWYFSDMELADKFYAQTGDLLYTWSASFGPHVWNGEKIIFHYHIWKIELTDSINREFLLQLLENDKDSILSNSNGSTMIHITKGGMELKEFVIPHVTEQQKIGTYFRTLDTLISQHATQLQKLQQIKSACLEKMFV